MHILNAMKNHFDKNPISLHVPGHHYQTIGNLKELSLKYDITEITGMDDLHHAEGIIRDSEQLITRIGYESHFLVNGTTVGLMSVILSYIDNNDAPSIGIMRNAHKSIFNAINIGSGSAYILPTYVSQTSGEYNGVNIEDIDRSMLSTLRLVVLTYPNYFGETYDIESLIKFFHDNNIDVLIDEAHGAHFNITHNFPESSLNYGADYVVQSYHKTLPAFTMSSVIHIANNVYSGTRNRVRNHLQMLQSSSPSYMFMLGLEQAELFYQKYDDTLFIERRDRLINALNQVFHVVEPADPLKIIVKHPAYSGIQIAKFFEEQYVFSELSNQEFMLLVLPLWHVNDDYLFDDLLERISSIHLSNNLLLSEGNKNLLYNQQDGVYIPLKEQSVHEIDVTSAEGKICVEHIIPYPPGIPFILAGETIQHHQVQHITAFIHAGGIVHGVENGLIKVRS